jgi:hypothetical protein
MLLFRAEEHLDRWSAQRGLPRGYLLTIDQAFRLAREWYQDKLKADWRRKTPDETSALFESLGLTGPFWKLKA